jgi:hypothetical protein
MAQSFNLNSEYVPIRERRRTTGTIAALNAEVVHLLNGDESAMIYVNASVGTWNATLEFTGTIDGTNYFSIPVYPMATASTSSTALPQSAQPLLIEAINGTSVIRTYAVATGQLAAIRVRASAWTAGSADVTIISDAENPSHPAVTAQRSSTLMVTATGAASAAVTATLPLVAGLRHYIDFIQVTRSATAALTAAATPVLVTTTNLPGTPALTFGSDAGGIGIDKEVKLDFGSTGLAATALGTATTVVCPIYTGVIWRVNVAYRLGI